MHGNSVPAKMFNLHLQKPEEYFKRFFYEQAYELHSCLKAAESS